MNCGMTWLKMTKLITALALMLATLLAAAEPLPLPEAAGPGESCPHGYKSSGSFCVPSASAHAGRHREAGEWYLPVRMDIQRRRRHALGGP